MTYLWYLFFARVIGLGVILVWYYGRKGTDNMELVAQDGLP